MVIFKWKEGTSKSEIDAIATEIKSLADIDGVTDLAFGPILQNGDQDYDYVISMRLPSKEFLEKTYMPHPIHMRVGGSLVKVMGAAIGADAEV